MVEVTINSELHISSQQPRGTNQNFRPGSYLWNIFLSITFQIHSLVWFTSTHDMQHSRKLALSSDPNLAAPAQTL